MYVLEFGMKRDYVYLVEKIIFLYFVVEMGLNFFFGYCIGSIFYFFEKLKLIFKVKVVLFYLCY